MPQLIDIGANEAFTDEDGLVINYKGENYYLACGELVTGDPDGASTYCVKRRGHQGNVHQDFDGTVAVDLSPDREKDQVVIVVAFDPPDTHVELMMKVSSIKHAFQDEITAKTVKVFMGKNAVSESVLAIFEPLRKESGADGER